MHISGNGYVNIKFFNEPMPYINKKKNLLKKIQTYMVIPCVKIFSLHSPSSLKKIKIYSSLWKNKDT